MCDSERSLLVVMLAQAAVDLADDKGHQSAARDWIDSDEDEVMSFSYCCDLLDLSVSATRKAIKASPKKIGHRLYAAAFEL